MQWLGNKGSGYVVNITKSTCLCAPDNTSDNNIQKVQPQCMCKSIHMQYYQYSIVSSVSWQL